MKKTSFARECYGGFRDLMRGRFRPLERVHCFVGPEEEKYLLFRKWGLLPKKAVWFFGAPGSLEMSCLGAKAKELGPDIKVGNSANPANNYIEAFKMLAELDLSGRKVLVPLSYGNDIYRDMILQKGEDILGEHFEPIMQFLPLEQYNQFMSRCGFVVMNHLRQQAGGNISADLWRGSKVYMNNTTYFQVRKSWGLSVELISEQNEKSFFTPKKQELIERDRQILRNKQGRDPILEKPIFFLKNAAITGIRQSVSREVKCL